MPKKILIAEDNPQNMKVVLMTLRPHGYTLLQATDGKEALEAGAAFSEARIAKIAGGNPTAFPEIHAAKIAGGSPGVAFTIVISK